MDKIDDKYQREEIHSLVGIDFNDEKIYENKVIELYAAIVCDGDLEFDNCIIHYDGSKESRNILLRSNGSLTLRNCQVRCDNFGENYFVCCTSGGRIKIINSEFNSCVDFLTGSPERGLIKGCTFINCSNSFINVTLTEGGVFSLLNCFIENNMVFEVAEQKELKKNKLSDNSSSDPLANSMNKRVSETSGQITDEQNSKLSGIEAVFKINGDEKIQFNNDYFYQDINTDNQPGFDYYVYSPSAQFERCTFQGLSKGLVGDSFDECKFEECSDWIKGKLFRYSDFYDCSDVIKCTKDTEIKHCEFNSCRDRLIEMGISCSINDCIFNDITNDSDFCSITVDYPDNESYASEINRSVFDGLKMNTQYLIGPANDIYQKTLNHPSLYIDKCRFENQCVNNSDENLLKTYADYTTDVSEHSYKLIEVSNSSGIDYVVDDSYDTDDLTINYYDAGLNGKETGADLRP